MENELRNAKAALDKSASTRSDLARRKPADRDKRLTEELLALSVAREPLRRHLLRAPKATARFFAPEVRAVSSEITRERRRLKRMLYGKPGKEGWLRGPPKPGGGYYVKPRKKPVPLSHLGGTVGQAKGELAIIRASVDVLERIDPSALPENKFYEFRDDAAELRQDAREVRLRIAKAQQRVKTSWIFFDDPPATLERLDRKARAIKEALRACERDAARLASARRATPMRPKQGWTREAAIRALDSWAKRHEGRWPRARELPNYSELPSRGTLGLLGVSLIADSPERR